MEFSGKAVIVTGAASGIGAASARLFANGGAKVLAVDVNPIEPDGVEGLTPHVADMAEEADVEAMVATAVERFGRLDILVNNAGIGSLARAADLTTAEWRRVMAIDLDAVFFASRKAIPHLIATRGAIVNVASISGMAADYGFPAYNTAKAGVIALTRNLAVDYAAQGVRVNSISPGLTRTGLMNMLPQELQSDYISRLPMGREGSPEDMANAIAFLASSKAAYITGQNLAVDGGLTAHTGAPNIIDFFSRLMSESQ